MSNQVSHYNFTQAGAPTLSGTAGDLIAVLDACLVNGWGAQTATSLTVSGTTATLTLPSTPAMLPQGLVNVSGATLTGFVNGDYKVQTVTGNVVTFNVAGVTAGTATGTIVAKVASLGWTKALSGTNKAVYKSSNPASTGAYLRVDDTGTLNARVAMYEAMSDVDTGTGLGQPATGGGFAAKSISADTITRQWHLIGDDRYFYFLSGIRNTPSFSTNNGGQKGWSFGDIIPVNSADNVYSAVLFSAIDATSAAPSTTAVDDISLSTASGGAQSGCVVMRDYTQTGAAISTAKMVRGYQMSNNQLVSGTPGGFTYPNPSGNGLLMAKMFVGSGTHVRGDLPGVFFIPQNFGSGTTPFANRDLVDGVGSLAGRKLEFQKTGAANNINVNSGCVFFDVTGPWR